MTTPFSPNQRDLAKAWLHIFPFIFIYLLFFHKTLCDTKRIKDISGTRFRQASPSSQLRDETRIIALPRKVRSSRILATRRLINGGRTSWRQNGIELRGPRGGHARARIPENACAYWHARIEHTLTLSITRIAGEPIRRNPAVRDHVYGQVRYSADDDRERERAGTLVEEKGRGRRRLISGLGGTWFPGFVLRAFELKN